jgi:hypothetical protein
MVLQVGMIVVSEFLLDKIKIYFYKQYKDIYIIL